MECSVGTSTTCTGKLSVIENSPEKETKTQRRTEKEIMSDMVIIFLFIEEYKKLHKMRSFKIN
jgi:hypothetical protein